MTLPTPMQIKAALDKLPPLQAENVGRGYIGIEVEWELDFESARTSFEDQNSIDISFDVPGEYMTIWCWPVRRSRYKQFNNMIPGTRVSVSGVIGEVSSSRSISLNNARFKFR